MERVAQIGYYNVVLFLRLQEYREIYKYHCFTKTFAYSDIRLRDLLNWCKLQQIDYRMRFYYRKDFPLWANVWNLFCVYRVVVGMKISEVIVQFLDES